MKLRIVELHPAPGHSEPSGWVTLAPPADTLAYQASSSRSGVAEKRKSAAIEEPDTPRPVAPLSLADLGAPPAFPPALDEGTSLEAGTPCGAPDEDRALFFSSMAGDHRLVSDEKGSDKADPFAQNWKVSADKQGPVNRSWELALAHQPRVDPTQRLVRGILSSTYVEAAIHLLTRRLGQVYQLGQPVRTQMSEIARHLDLRVLANDAPSPLERVNLRRLVHSLNVQAKLIKRVDESWQGLTLRGHDMGQLLAGRARLPAEVQDPFSEEPRHLWVSCRLDLKLVEAVLDDVSEAAHGARTMELAPLLTSIHHLRARLLGVLNWSPHAGARLRADAVHRRNLPDRR